MGQKSTGTGTPRATGLVGPRGVPGTAGAYTGVRGGRTLGAPGTYYSTPGMAARQQARGQSLQYLKEGQVLPSVLSPILGLVGTYVGGPYVGAILSAAGQYTGIPTGEPQNYAGSAGSLIGGLIGSYVGAGAAGSQIGGQVGGMAGSYGGGFAGQSQQQNATNPGRYRTRRY